MAGEVGARGDDAIARTQAWQARGYEERLLEDWNDPDQIVVNTVNAI
jgi:hypothetical protein